MGQTLLQADLAASGALGICVMPGWQDNLLLRIHPQVAQQRLNDLRIYSMCLIQ